MTIDTPDIIQFPPVDGMLRPNTDICLIEVRKEGKWIPAEEGWTEEALEERKKWLESTEEGQEFQRTWMASDEIHW